MKLPLTSNLPAALSLMSSTPATSSVVAAALPRTVNCAPLSTVIVSAPERPPRTEPRVLTISVSSPAPRSRLPVIVAPEFKVSVSSPAPRLTPPVIVAPECTVSVSAPAPRLTLLVTVAPECTVSVSLPLPSSTAPSSEAPVLTVRVALPFVSTIARPPPASISAPLSSVIVTAFPVADLILIPYFFSEAVLPSALSTCPDMVTSMVPFVCRDMAAEVLVRWNFPFTFPIKSPAEMVRAPLNTLP